MTGEPEVFIYTDGACSGNPGPGGWGVLLKHPATKSIKTFSGGDPSTTNNRMELQAAIEGLKALKSDERLHVRLVSDSKYVLLGLKDWMKGWIANGWCRGKKGGPPVKNADLWQELHALIQKHDMSYKYVRGHTGHQENEECDRLATGAIKAMREQRA